MTFSNLLLLTAVLAGPKQSSSAEIDVDSVTVTLVKQVEVPARESGVLASIRVREGQLVKRGDLLADIDDTKAAMILRRAVVDVKIAEKRAGNDIAVRYAHKKSEVAANELRRARESRKKLKNSVSDTEFDRLTLLEQESILQVEQADHELSTEKLNLKLKESDLQIATRDVERRKIVAPLSGMVVQVNRQAGEWVEPGNTVVRIVRVDRLRAEGFLQANDVSEDLTKRTATLTVSLPGRPKAKFQGTVVYVTPEINPVNGEVRFWAEFDNPRLELRPGMKGSLIIHAAAASQPEKILP